MIPSSVFRVLWLAVLLLPGCAASDWSAAHDTNAASHTPGFVVAPGVVVESDGTTVYTMRPGGGIEAVDVPRGTASWSSDAASKPLAVENGRLLAQQETDRRGALPLAILNTSKGGDRVAEIEIPLPGDVSALIEQHLGISFSIRSHASRGVVTLSWSYIERDVSGVAPPPGTPPVRRRLDGAAAIDLGKGTFEVLDGAYESPTPTLPQDVQRMVDSGELRLPPWQVDKSFVAPSLEKTESGQSRVVIKRWRSDSWRKIPQLTLYEGVPRAQLPSAGGRHLVITSMPDAHSAPFERYLWSVFSLTDGEMVGNLRWHTSATPFCVTDSILMMVSQPFSRRLEGRLISEPLMLRAFNITSGHQIWGRPLRDTRYRGPQPAGH